MEKFIKAKGLMVLAVASITSLLFVIVLKPTSLGAAVFLCAWLLFPYAALSLDLMFWSKKPSEAIAIFYVAVVISGGGLFFLAFLILNPNPQGGIAVIFTPIYQVIGLIILYPLSKWYFSKHR